MYYNLKILIFLTIFIYKKWLFFSCFLIKLVLIFRIEKIPDLCVLTDMQWDSAMGSRVNNPLTSLENLKLTLFSN